jgi:diguanylate cyclase (GGDEF)-like protein
LAAPLAPGTAQLGGRASASRAGAAPTATVHGVSGVVQPARSPATVISHFIAVIPTAVWIALAIAFGVAATAAAAAVVLGRRASRRATEMAAVTAAAVTDQLTGVLNRRGFTQTAQRELERARRYGHPLALAYVDVRGLKAVNDTEGHLAGDRLLRQVADLLTRSARTHDVVGRIGGDELAVLLAEQAEPGAGALTHRIRERVPEHRAALGLRTRWDVTIGIASSPNDGDTLEELIAAADRRMYEERGIELRRS